MVITDLSNGNNVGEQVDISPGIIGTLIASRKRSHFFIALPDLLFCLKLVAVNEDCFKTNGKPLT